MSNNKTDEQHDPVLKAIDEAKWSANDIMDVVSRLDTETMQFAISGANLQIEKIRTAYLASKKKSFRANF